MVSTMNSASVHHRASPRLDINLRRGRRSVHAVKDAGLSAGRQLGLLCLALLAGAADAEECYCDRWFSTNTRTLDYPTPRRSRMVTSGMSYSGPKSTALNGMGCMPWKEVFDACSEGFEQMQIRSTRVWSWFNIRVEIRFWPRTHALGGARANDSGWLGHAWRRFPAGAVRRHE